MNQLAISPTVSQARALRDDAMDRVSRDRQWGDEAYVFLVTYALHHALINPERAAETAIRCGVSPPRDGRQWGPVYMRAVRQGLIERSRFTYKRRRGHLTTALLWKSNVCPAHDGAVC